MKVEILIYAYLAVCAAMIVFNIVCIFVFRHKDKKLDRYSEAFELRVKEQIRSGGADAEHKRLLKRRLMHIDYLAAFDKALGELYDEYPEKTRQYIESVASVFAELMPRYVKRNNFYAAYFPYIIKRYRIFEGRDVGQINDILLSLVKDSSLYCRENALQAIYSVGDAELAADALGILDKSGYYHNSKLISDGLLEFRGDRAELSRVLRSRFGGFSEKMQVSILDFFRFSPGAEELCEWMLMLMTSRDIGDEAAYSCIRYFGKYAYAPAYPYLLDYAEAADAEKWEYTAISASALAAYPCEKTEDTLKMLLHSRNWYVRFNASQSLESMGVGYDDLIDILEGGDRYAAEIMQYRLDQKRLKESEAAPV